MKAILLVALGGALGSVARYKVSDWMLPIALQLKFPAGTFAVNVVGCLLAGLLAGMAERLELFAGETRLLVFVGLLGGFTTFSAFGLETVMLLRKGDIAIAAAYVLLSVAAGLGALWLALGVGRG